VPSRSSCQFAASTRYNSLLWRALDLLFAVKRPFPYLAYGTCVARPFYLIDIIGQCANKLWGIDKLMIGIAAGSAPFFLGARWYARIKLRRGHAYFSFQKVVMPIAPLIVASLIFYYIVK
jgi:hypothetical protein